MSSSRPVTRSRAHSGIPALDDVSRYLESMTTGSSHFTTRRAVSERRELVDTLRSFIDRRIRSLTNTRLIVSDEYMQICEQVLVKFAFSIIRQLAITSLHRADQLQDLHTNEDDVMETPVRSTSKEEWLLYKEDCATYFGRSLKNVTDVSGESETQPGLSSVPEFNQAEYAAHAAEEEKRILITAQSVRRITLRDLLAALPSIKMPVVVERNIVNYIAFHEISTEYRARGYATSSPSVGFSLNPSIT
jgi:hypothetical protein